MDKPFNFNNAILAIVRGKVNKNLPPIANRTANIIKPKMYLRVTIDVPISFEEATFIKETFVNQYKCREINELISKLNTHPTSIVLAQAALESGWGTSRFYREANNLFGVWSYNENESRIKAMEDREGQSVYVRKYDALPESIVSYFKTIARGPYSEFRAAREKISEVSVLISYLEVYSELREEYVKRLDQLIQYNKLEKYDSYRLKMSDE